jgi:hypothetical protein
MLHALIATLGSCSFGPKSMTTKLFVNYRRGDSAADALGIAQYFAQAFGGQNVF